MKNSLLRWAGLLALAFAISGCDGSNPAVANPGGVNVAPTVTLDEPSAALTVSRGGILGVSYTDDDPDDVATTDVFADQDGDLGTTGDQIVLATNRPEGNGALQTMMWDTTGADPGTYRIVARTDDGANPPVQASASGTVEVADVAYAVRAGGTSDDEARGVAAFADGSCVVTGRFMGTATFGPGQAGETSLTAEGGDDVFVARYDAGGALAWARRAGGTGQEDPHDVAAFTDGSCVVTGWFRGTATFGPGEAGETSLTASAWDVFVARYDAGGALAWARRAGGTSDDEGHGVAAFADGSCVVMGRFTGTATFGPGEAGETSLTVEGVEDVFVARYDADGTLAWATQAGGTSDDEAYDVAAFTDGSCVVTGRFTGTATFGPGEAGETSLTAAGGDDLFVARYDADGTLAWVTQAGGTSDSRGSGVAAFTDGSCVVTGWFTGTATFGPGEAGETSLTAEGGEDVLVARYNADGALAWATRAGGTSDDGAYDVAAFTDGSCVVTGRFFGTATFGPGEAGETSLTAEGGEDVFVALYDADGTLAWARRAGGTSDDGGAGVAAFADGSCVVTGWFSGTATFGPGDAGETSLTAEGDEDLFVACYNADGGF